MPRPSTILLGDTKDWPVVPERTAGVDCAGVGVESLGAKIVRLAGVASVLHLGRESLGEVSEEGISGYCELWSIRVSEDGIVEEGAL